ncbi:LIF receptor subunit alpha a [Brachyhypopomus gauderio]|uniref:LIF receptor subunit alpha a n=1 Tax=Brachyhypopomus gauderio TaxID=698409 RepID=UPI0040433E73
MMKILLLFLLPVQVSLLHSELPVPQSVSLEKDLPSQTLSLTWESDASVFDIEIFRTELEEQVLNVSVLAGVNPGSGRRAWSWRSEVPLQCTSHSVRIRAREQHAVSEWSPLLTIPGSDLPENAEGQMYPQDKVVAVGSRLAFCCILPEGQADGRMSYMNKDLTVTMLSRRTLGASVDNLPASRATGTNIICSTPLHSILSGAVVFVGYAPHDEGLQCETRDLVSAECRWSKGQDTNLWKRAYQTQYTLNGRPCVEAGREEKLCRFDKWQDSWTLVATNPLGTVQLNDSARLTERVRLMAPRSVVAVPQAWNASLQWSWAAQRCQSLDMICQVHLTNRGRTHTRNYTGVGLSSVFLDGLMPDADYSVSVCCASLHNFWQWGDCSTPYSMRTKMDRPEAPDVWVSMDTEDTGRVLWKPLSVSASHGPLLGYEVSQREGEEDGGKSLFLPQNVSSLPISLSNSSHNVIITVAARNSVGLSQRSAVPVPRFRADLDPLPGSKLVGGGGDLNLTWPVWPNASHGYVLEWAPTCCSGLCSIQWMKVLDSNTSGVVQSGSLLDGERYTISVFALSHEAAVLLQRHHGYGHELVPVQPVGALSAQQSGSSVLLTWDPVPICDQKGFVRGYRVYLTDASNPVVADVTDPAQTSYTVESLIPGSYKFTVKAYTSAGEGSGATIAIKMETDSDMLVVEILVALGIMSCNLIIISIFCYKKREWVKKAFYPEIPGPKLTAGWTTPAGPLDVKSPLHSLVHIVESPEWETGKGTLVPVHEEEDEDSTSQNIDVDTDSDEPALLRYYNQLVSDGSQSNHVSDSSGTSTSSVDSAQTQVTYTGIQSPAPSQAIQSPTPLHDGQSPIFSKEALSNGYRPQMQPTVGIEGPGAGLESDPQEDSSNVGYKPQCSWQVDSEAEVFSGSLGSPTSVTSSQFLIPEASEGRESSEPPGTWFQNLLSGKF